MSGAHVLASKERSAWVDVARGLLIVLVVLYHVTLVFTVPLVPAGSSTEAFLDSIVAAMRPFRMPLFFLISGYLAKSAVARPWGVLVRSKSAYFYLLYLTWFVIHSVVQTVTADGRPAISSGESDSPPSLGWLDPLVGATIAPTFLWFLTALAVYFPLAKLVARFGHWPLLPAGIAYLVSAQGWPDMPFNQAPGVIAFFFWFYLGLTERSSIAAIAQRTHITVFIGAVIAFGAAQFGELLIGSRTTVLLGLASIGASIFGLATSGIIARSVPGLRRPLESLGRMTLPIYVMHMPVLWTAQVITSQLFGEGFIRNETLAITVVAGMTALIIAVSMGIYRLVRPWVRWMFDPPVERIFRRRLRTASRTVRSH